MQGHSVITPQGWQKLARRYLPPMREIPLETRRIAPIPTGSQTTTSRDCCSMAWSGTATPPGSMHLYRLSRGGSVPHVRDATEPPLANIYEASGFIRPSGVVPTSCGGLAAHGRTPPAAKQRKSQVRAMLGVASSPEDQSPCRSDASPAREHKLVQVLCPHCSTPMPGVQS
jgi:hypothetical protein